MIKKISVMFAAVCMALMYACAWADVGVHHFKANTNNPPGHPVTMGLERFAELVQHKSGGKMTVSVYSGGVLGADQHVLAFVRQGNIDFAAMNTGYLQDRVKAFAVVDLPFLISSHKEADALYGGALGKRLAELAPLAGVVNLDYWELGFRHMTNSRRPITTADDIKGLKIRVIPSPTYVDTFAALGANPTPMPFTEVYSALEMKVIDGQENPLAVIEKNRFYEAQKYLTLTAHIYNPQSLFASSVTWEKLNQAERNIIQAAAIEAGRYQRALSRTDEARSLERLRSAMQINALPGVELERIRAKLRPVIAKYRGSIGAEIYDLANAETAKIRK